QLFDGLDQARMPAEDAEPLVVGVGRERGTRRARFFAPNLRAVDFVDALRLAAQDLHFLRREAVGQEQPAFVLELLDLLGVEFHERPPLVGVRPSGSDTVYACVDACCSASNCCAVASPAAAVWRR